MRYDVYEVDGRGLSIGSPVASYTDRRTAERLVREEGKRGVATAIFPVSPAGAIPLEAFGSVARVDEPWYTPTTCRSGQEPNGYGSR